MIIHLWTLDVVIQVVSAAVIYGSADKTPDKRVLSFHYNVENKTLQKIYII